MAEGGVFPDDHPFTVLFAGHSMIQYEMCNRNDPVLSRMNLNLEFMSLRGAWASTFLARDEVQRAIARRPHLVILWIGGNDIRPEVNPSELARNIVEIMDAFERQPGVGCVWMTIEPRRHPRDIPVEIYKRIANSVNQKVQRLKRGRIFITGGRTYHPDLVGGDGIHPSPEAYTRISEKLSGTIHYYHTRWYQQRLRERDRLMRRRGLEHPDQLRVFYDRRPENQ